MKNLNFKQATNAKTHSYNLQNNTALINEDTYSELRNMLSHNSIVRFSLHDSPNSLTQSMLIAIKNTTLIKQHKNITKDKIYHVIEGILEFSLHNSDTYIIKQNEIFKLEKNQFASIKALSKVAIYNEIIAGPFYKDDTIYLNE